MPQFSTESEIKYGNNSKWIITDSPRGVECMKLVRAPRRLEIGHAHRGTGHARLRRRVRSASETLSFSGLFLLDLPDSLSRYFLSPFQPVSSFEREVFYRP